MKAILALAFIPVWELKSHKTFCLQKFRWPYSSQVMQSVDIRLCMYVDMLMAFIHAKF